MNAQGSSNSCHCACFFKSMRVLCYFPDRNIHLSHDQAAFVCRLKTGLPFKDRFAAYCPQSAALCVRNLGQQRLNRTAVLRLLFAKYKKIMAKRQLPARSRIVQQWIAANFAPMAFFINHTDQPERNTPQRPLIPLTNQSILLGLLNFGLLAHELNIFYSNHN